jgi:hypothetical protein
LSWRIKPLEALIPQVWAKLTYPLDKSNLDPFRLFHFLALAVLAAWFVPRNWRGLMTPVMRCAIRCGQNSLPIFCIGVLLALASHMALFDISDGLAMQIGLSLAGIAVMIAIPTLLNSIIKPNQPSQYLATAISENAYERRETPSSPRLPPVMDMPVVAVCPLAAIASNPIDPMVRVRNKDSAAE